MFRLNFDMQYNLKYCYISTVLGKTEVFKTQKKTKVPIEISNLT